mmetsp:Transcript_22963/g.46986  ORF Transcript_22963/g.46986 Transcript_22963/m.46986 type:complete len:212 (+) Transcript_22963:246-881(+)
MTIVLSSSAKCSRRSKEKNLLFSPRHFTFSTAARWFALLRPTRAARIIIQNKTKKRAQPAKKSKIMRTKELRQMTQLENEQSKLKLPITENHLPKRLGRQQQLGKAAAAAAAVPTVVTEAEIVVEVLSWTTQLKSNPTTTTAARARAAPRAAPRRWRGSASTPPATSTNKLSLSSTVQHKVGQQQRPPTLMLPGGVKVSSPRASEASLREP